MNIISPNFADMLSPNVELKHYPDNDSYIRIPALNVYTDKEVTLFHRLYPNQDSAILQAIFLLNALSSVNASVTLVAPYLPYSRQDKLFIEGEVKSSEIVCKMLENAGAKKLVTFNCHFLKKEGEFNTGKMIIKNMSIAGKLIDHAKKRFTEKFDIVAPDKGAYYLVEKFGGKVMEKSRGGYVKESEVAIRNISKMEAKFKLDEKNVLLVDDIIAGGGTMIEACKILRNMGAKKIACCATHGFFIGDALEKLKEVSDYIFVTNSINCPVSEVDILEELKKEDLF